MPPALRSTIPGSTASDEVVHAKDIELHLGLLAGRVERGDRAERRGARVGAQDRDVALGQFVAQLARARPGRRGRRGAPRRSTPYCSVSRSANALSTSSRRAVMIRWCPRAASSVASASPMFCEAPVTTARASGLGAGTGMRRTISWATMSELRGRPRKPQGGRECWRGRCGTVGSTGVNAIVVTFVFSVYLTRTVGDDLPGDDQPAELARPGAGARRPRGRPARPGHRGLGRRTVAPAPGAGRADRAGGAADLGDEPDPRRLPATCGRPGAAGRAPRRATTWPPSRTTRCCDSSRRRRRPVGYPDSAGRRLFRQRGAAARGLRRASSPATATPAGCSTCPPPTARTSAPPCC